MAEDRSLPGRNQRRSAAVRPAAAWSGLIAATVAEMYLALMLALAAIAMLPLLLGWHASVVQSESMRPHIDAGDVVVSAPWSPGDPVPMGGVVEFRSPAEAEPDNTERLRLHRIVDAHDDGTLVTAGDANAEVDSTPLDRAQITAQARLLVPDIGLPAHWAQTGQWRPLGLWGGATTVALVLVGLQLRRSEPPPVQDREDTSNAPEDITAPRREVLLGVGVLAAMAGAVVLHRVPPVGATFTARTTNPASTWSVADRPSVSLGRAATYVLLASTRIQANSNSSIVGSIAISPGTTINGFGPQNVTGSIDKNTPAARNARTDALTLHSALTELPATQQRPQSLTGTIRPGVYTSTRRQFSLSGSLVLDAGGDSKARFVFRAEQIIANASTTIELVGGALPANVFFHGTDSITINASSTLRGVYLAYSDITVNETTQLHGHLIALHDSITLNGELVAQRP